VNITTINLNLLLAFEALMEEQHVSRAASRIGLSQPAMSNALARLREITGDPLFQRTSHGVRATARAVELAGPVRAGLAQLRNAFAERPRFDPATSTRRFRIALTDYAELVLMGPMLRSVARTAPNVQVVLRRVDSVFTPPEEQLRSGAFDAAIGFYPEANALDPHTLSADLFAEENVCVARKGHPLMKKRLTLREFAAARHIAVFYRDETVGLVDNILAGHGMRRRLQAATPHFLAAISVVAKSDLIAIVPAGLASRFRSGLNLETRKAPILLPTFHMRLLWHEHTSDDPAQQWLRAEIVRAARADSKQPPA
jgi:DNA-binding transcriptional LysR family regulator